MSKESVNALISDPSLRLWNALSSASSEVAMEGVSVHHLAKDLWDAVLACGFDEGATVADIEPRIIRPAGLAMACPRDNSMGAAYVDTLSGNDHVGHATHMLSYTWGYTVKDIVDALSQYCQNAHLDPKRTYVWICAFCINQHRVKALQDVGQQVPFSEFQAAFASRVTNIGTMIALMAPWENPKYLTRVWCVFEMFTALVFGERSIAFL